MNNTKTHCKGCNIELDNGEYWCHGMNCYYKILGDTVRENSKN